MKMKNILFLSYKDSNHDDLLYMDDDLICSDVRQFKVFIKRFNLVLVKTIDYGDYVEYYYKVKGE